MCARAVGQFRELVQWAEQDRAVCETVKKVCQVVHVTLQVAVQCMQRIKLTGNIGVDTGVTWGKHSGHNANSPQGKLR